jgi:hydrogenase-4 component B
MLSDSWSYIMKDHLTLYFVLLILLIVVPVFIYSLGYIKEYKKSYSIKYLWFMMIFFVFAMLGVVISNNSLSFIVFWELMSASSFLMVIYDYKEKENLRSGIMYFIMTHISGLFIMLMFAMLYKFTGSMNFKDIMQLAPMLSITKKSIIIILAILGFGAKAGLVPLHAWLPKAHPAAPSNISSLMSGVMLKVALYGFIRVTFIFIRGIPLAFGISIMLIGAISAALSIFNALFQEDIKKLLAYSSAENIGVIFSTLGLSMILNYYGLKELEILALTAALFHILNHAVFKSLLFTCAGSVLYGTSSKKMNELGGLCGKMKLTAYCTFIGTAAIGAVPPLNGFASEVLILKSFIAGAQAVKSPGIVFVIFLSGVTFAITSGLVLWTCVKCFGITFLGAPRSKKAKEVHSIPLTMNIGMVILSAFAIILGVLSPFVISFISKLANSIQGINVNISSQTFGFEITFIALILAIIIGLLLIFNKLTSKAEIVEHKETWGCGFNNLKPFMQYSGSGYSQPATRLLGNFVGYEKEVRIKNTIYLRQKFADIIEVYIYMNIARLFDGIAKRIIKIHYGKIQAYIAYIFISLIIAVLLVMNFV